jgi:imidazolonepropionase
MGAQLKANAISHLEEVSQKGIQDMAKSGTVAILLPTTAYVMNLRPPPARQMIEAEVPVALGTDFNPNAHCLAMVSKCNLQNSEFHTI